MNNKPHNLYAINTNFYWIELGGMQNSIDDTEEIKDELLKIAFGVWDHIKNHGDHGAENWDLEWVSFLPGKRESRRYIGDYVLTGGELAAGVIADAIVRIIPGVISDEQSALSDSFQDNLLAAPVYTRPAEYNGWKVPDILLSGHEAKIKEWELQQSLERTQRLRPDLLK